jgi:hypothetical protein
MAVKMDLKTAIEVLRKHQAWRNGWDVAPTRPITLTQAIDIVLDAATKCLENLEAIKSILDEGDK